MKRVEENSTWTLIDPYEIRMKYKAWTFCELYGIDWKYLWKIEADENIKFKKVVSARELFKSIMKKSARNWYTLISFLKIEANEMNHNSHEGMIGSKSLYGKFQ